MPGIKLLWDMDKARNPILGYMVRFGEYIYDYSLIICYSPVCQRQILTFPATKLNDVGEIAVQRSINHNFSMGFPDSEQHSRTSRSIHPTKPEPKINGIEPELEEDISFFKRIVQEITDLQRKPSIIEETTLQAFAESIVNFKLFDRAFIVAKEHLYSPEPVGGVRGHSGLQKSPRGKVGLREDCETAAGSCVVLLENAYARIFFDRVPRGLR